MLLIFRSYDSFLLVAVEKIHVAIIFEDVFTKEKIIIFVFQLLILYYQSFNRPNNVVPIHTVTYSHMTISAPPHPFSSEQFYLLN